MLAGVFHRCLPRVRMSVWLEAYCFYFRKGQLSWCSLFSLFCQALFSWLCCLSAGITAGLTTPGLASLLLPSLASFTCRARTLVLDCAPDFSSLETGSPCNTGCSQTCAPPASVLGMTARHAQLQPHWFLFRLHAVLIFMLLVTCASMLWLTKQSHDWTCYIPLAFAAPVFCTWRMLLGCFHCGVLSSLLPVTFCERGSQIISAVTLQQPGPISLTLPCPPSLYATFACSMNPRDTAVISCYVDSCHYKKREPCILS